MSKLKGKGVIVVGASGAIGSAVSRLLLQEGAKVALVARSADKLQKTSDALGEGDKVAIPADASSFDDMKGVFDTAEEAFGRVDAIIISAGSWHRLGIDNEPDEAIALADMHYDGLYLPSFVSAFLAQKRFRKQGSGLIVSISSHAAVRYKLPGNLTYGPMKAAQRQLMLMLGHELKGSGVRVTDIQPAIVNTPDNASLLSTEEDRRKAVQPEHIAEWIVEHFDDPDIPGEILMGDFVV